MGDDLALKGRDAFRTPMQWDGGPGAGFSKADPEAFTKPLVDEGPFAYTEVNVARQRGRGDSLLTWTQRLINVRRECPETGDGSLTLVDGEGVPPEVLAHRVDGLTGSLLFLHNLCDEERTVDLTKAKGLDDAGQVEELLADAAAEPLADPADGLRQVALTGYGYRWIRLVH